MKKSNKKADLIIIAVLIISIGLISILSIVNNSESKRDSEILQSATFEDYENGNIGVFTGSNNEAISDKIFPNGKKMYFDSLADLMYALSVDKIDTCCVDFSILDEYMSMYDKIGYIDEPVQDVDYGVMFQKDNAKADKIRLEFNQFLAKLKENGTLKELQDIWIDGSDESKQIVDRTELTGKNGKLTYATCTTQHPFSFIKNGEYAGYDVAIAVLFAKEYGYDLDIVDCQFGSIISGIQSGKYDFASCSITITEERKESVNFSDPNYKTGMYFAINNAPNSLAAQNEANKSDSFVSSVMNKFEKTFIREARWKLIAKGIGTTLLITIASTILGCILAFLICMLRRTGSIVGNTLCNLYVRLLQGTPMVVLLMIIYYIIFGKSNLNPIIPAVIGFTLNLGAYGSEMMQSGIKSINDGQREAALALGYTENQAFFKFIFPQAAQRFLPVLKGEIVSLLKGTSVVGYIAIQDLTKMSDIIRSQTYEAFFPLLTSAIIYMLLSWILITVFGKIEFNIDPKRKAQKKAERRTSND